MDAVSALAPSSLSATSAAVSASAWAKPAKSRMQSAKAVTLPRHNGHSFVEREHDSARNRFALLRRARFVASRVARDGVIAGKTVRAVLESAGVKDVLSKSLGSKNPANVVKATLHALKQLRLRDQIYRSRGIAIKTDRSGATPAATATA